VERGFRGTAQLVAGCWRAAKRTTRSSAPSAGRPRTRSSARIRAGISVAFSGS